MRPQTKLIHDGNTYVAFLRGINVGGRIIKMAALRACFEAMGFGEVKTYLQSGNVVFQAANPPDGLKQKIEDALTRRFHYPAKAIVRPLDKVRAVVDAYPFGLAGPSQHDYVIFIEDGLEKALVAESYSLADAEQVKAGEQAVYWRVDKGSTLKSSFATLLTKARYKDFNTNRNLKTLRKLLG